MLGQAAEEAGDARDVEALLAFGHRAAEHDVLDEVGRDARVAGHQASDHLPGHLVGAGVGEGALVRPAYGGANRIHDYDISHLYLLSLSQISFGGACWS